MTTPPTPDAGVGTCGLCMMTIVNTTAFAQDGFGRPVHRWMSACIAALRGKLETITRDERQECEEVQRLHDAYDYVIANNVELTAHLAAANADAARYRWLKARYVGFRGLHGEDHDKCVMLFRMDAAMRFGADLDKTVDAARTEAP